jgi:hypothetical protein
MRLLPEKTIAITSEQAEFQKLAQIWPLSEKKLLWVKGKCFRGRLGRLRINWATGGYRYDWAAKSGVFPHFLPKTRILCYFRLPNPVVPAL